MQMECKTNNVVVRDVKYPVDNGQSFFLIYTLVALD